jgi:hypothetical protein
VLRLARLAFPAVDFEKWTDPLTAGTWPDWFAAIGTVAAFTVGLIVYLRSRQDTKRSQARLVHAYCHDVLSVRKGQEPHFPVPDSIFGDEDFEHVFPDEGPKVEVWYAKRPLIVLIVKVENNSDEIVTQVIPRLFVTDSDGDNLDLELTDVPILVPKSSVLRYATFGHGELGQGGKVAATSFTDSSGRRWYRHERKPLHRRRWWNRYN